MKPHIDCLVQSSHPWNHIHIINKTRHNMYGVFDICTHIPVGMYNYDNKRKKEKKALIWEFWVIRELSGKGHRREWRKGRMEGKMV